MDEGLIDEVLARGAIWRDPATGRQRDARRPPTTPADRAARARGIDDGRDAPGRRRPAGWTRSSTEWRPGSGAAHEIREPATGMPPDDPPVDARGRRAAPPRRPPPPSPPGRRRTTRSGPRSCAERPTSTRLTRRVRHVDAARDGRPPQQDAPRAELHRRGAPERGVDAVPAVRLAAADGATPGGCRWCGACRSASSARSRHGTRRACWACASSRRPWPSATRSCSSPIRRHRSAAGRCSPPCSRRRGCRTGCCRSSSAGRTSGEALVTDPNVDMVSFTGSTAAGRRVGALAGGLLKKVSLELGGNNAFVVLDDADLDAAASRAPIRRSSSRARSASPSGATSSIATSPTSTSTCWLPRRSACAWATPIERTSTWARSSTSSSWPGWTASSSARSPEAPGWSRAAPTGAVLPTDRACRRHDRGARVDRRDLRSGRAGRPLRHGRRGRRAGQRQRLRARCGRLFAVDLARPGDRQPDQGRDGPRQRPDHQ